VDTYEYTDRSSELSHSNGDSRVAWTGFTEHDDQMLKSYVVSETLAKSSPGEDAIGKFVGLDEETLGKIQIVGIARNVKYNSQAKMMNR